MARFPKLTPSDSAHLCRITEFLERHQDRAGLVIFVENEARFVQGFVSKRRLVDIPPERSYYVRLGELDYFSLIPAGKTNLEIQPTPLAYDYLHRFEKPWVLRTAANILDELSEGVPLWVRGFRWATYLLAVLIGALVGVLIQRYLGCP